MGESLSFGNPSKQVHVKIDLNHFIAKGSKTERRPILRGQLSFVILTYDLPNLMASKIAAIFLRGGRSVDGFVYEEKGRDIYDLLWYMNKKIVPEIGYLKTKNIEVENLKNLFDKLTVKMKRVSDQNLKQDLIPLFLDIHFIENWLKNWRETYLSLLQNYE